MKMEFVPCICKDQPAEGEEAAKPATYTGKIVLIVPRSVERHEYIRQSGLMAIVEKSDGKKDEVAIGLADQYGMMTKLMGFVEKHIEKVELVRKEDGLVVNTVDAFLSIASCEPAVQEICKMFMKGFEPGKNLEA